MRIHRISEQSLKRTQRILASMSAITSPALALTRAFDRFERSSARAVEAAHGLGGADLAVEFANLSQAKVEARAAVANVRFADAMWQALLDMATEPQRRR